MIAYKGFTKEMSAILGNGTYHFEPGKKAVTEKSKTVSCGFHCCENPFECLSYYRLDGENRFFMVEVEGDIDEDESERIAGTEITPIKELTDKEFALAGMKYIIEHPARIKWEQNYREVRVVKDKADYKEARIVIVRGENPVVMAYIGQIVGIIKEKSGDIVAAKLFEVKEKAGKYTRAGSSDRYFDRISQRETYICFLRKIETPEDPFYTIEVEPNGTIRQHRGYLDEEPDIELVKPFLREWQKAIKPRLNKKDMELAEISKIKRLENIEELKEKNNTRVLEGLEEDFMEAI